MKNTAIKTAETNIKTRQKEDIEESNRAHLRGFSRTTTIIFNGLWMNTTLANF